MESKAVFFVAQLSNNYFFVLIGSKQFSRFLRLQIVGDVFFTQPQGILSLVSCDQSYQMWIMIRSAGRTPLHGQLRIITHEYPRNIGLI